MNKNTPSVEGRQEAWEAMIADERTLLLNKGADYTAGKKDADAYANFRIIADLLDGAPITPYTVAMVYALKHVLSLITFCKTGKQESGEGLRGRHMDARNYFFILNELIPDHLNSFEKEAMAAKVNELLDAVANINLADYGTTIVEDPLTGAAEYFDEDDQKWYPLSELDTRKEVNNTTENYRLDAWSCPGSCCLGLPLIEIGDLRNKS